MSSDDLSEIRESHIRDLGEFLLDMFPDEIMETPQFAYDGPREQLAANLGVMVLALNQSGYVNILIQIDRIWCDDGAKFNEAVRSMANVAHFKSPA